MITHKVRWQGKNVTVNLHSELDAISKIAMEAFIERSLEVYELTKCDDPILLSQYNKRLYGFLVREQQEGFQLDFFTRPDFDEKKLPAELMAEIIERDEMKPISEAPAVLFPVSEKKMPW
jgi:hypothetical protein